MRAVLAAVCAAVALHTAAGAPTPENPRLLTIIVPYYNQHALIYDQFRRWSQYSEEVQSKMEVVIVDDGSQREPLETIFREAESKGDLPKTMPVLGVTLDKDIGFNHGGACNTVGGPPVVGLLCILVVGWCCVVERGLRGSEHGLHAQAILHRGHVCVVLFSRCRRVG